MRPLFFALALLGCAADPAVAPRDCTPGQAAACVCPGAAGSQTCGADGRLGACVCPDGGAGDAAVVDVATEDRVSIDVVTAPDVTAGLDVVDAGASGPDVVDAGPVMTCGDTSVNVLNGVRQSSGVFTHCGACGRSCAVGERCSGGSCGPTCPNGISATCDGRSINLQVGEPDGGIRYHCGACGNHCAAGEFCINCVCVR